ncbi:hypothetical protein C8R42DRAFT_263711 [Lentinula raphanica]|nr:hypothetical protein C8R42DRAFT_263711 [Lentinula raphanica]
MPLSLVRGLISVKVSSAILWFHAGTGKIIEFLSNHSAKPTYHPVNECRTINNIPSPFSRVMIVTVGDMLRLIPSLKLPSKLYVCNEVFLEQSWNLAETSHTAGQFFLV